MKRVIAYYPMPDRPKNTLQIGKNKMCDIFKQCANPQEAQYSRVEKCIQ